MINKDKQTNLIISFFLISYAVVKIQLIKKFFNVEKFFRLTKKNLWYPPDFFCLSLLTFFKCTKIVFTHTDNRIQIPFFSICYLSNCRFHLFCFFNIFAIPGRIVCTFFQSIFLFGGAHAMELYSSFNWRNNFQPFQALQNASQIVLCGAWVFPEIIFPWLLCQKIRYCFVCVFFYYYSCAKTSYTTSGLRDFLLIWWRN